MDLDEVAHYEPPHQDLSCMQILLYASLVVQELNNSYMSLNRALLHTYSLSLSSSHHPVMTEILQTDLQC